MTSKNKYEDKNRTQDKNRNKKMNEKQKVKIDSMKQRIGSREKNRNRNMQSAGNRYLKRRTQQNAAQVALAMNDGRERVAKRVKRTMKMGKKVK